jgi:Mannitol dehydrogenase C-terminal domain
VLHVHIGLSPLAQALILTVARSAGFESFIVGRIDKPAPPFDDKGEQSYELKWEGTDPRDEACPIHSFLQFDSFEDLPDELLKRIGTEDAMLLTASIRGAIDERRSFVRDLLKARPEGSQTLVIPCENKVPKAWSELEGELGGTDILFVESVVNRIAVPVEDADAEPGARATRTHPVGEWVIKDPRRKSKALDALRQRPEVKVVDRLEPYKTQKLFLVNGGHLAVAIRAAYRNIDRLRDAAREREALVDVTGLHGAMILGLTRGDGSRFPQNAHEYAKEQVAAYCQVDDDVRRILKPLRRANPAPFFAAVKDRLTEAALLTAEAEAALRTGDWQYEWLTPYIIVFRQLEVVLERLTSYSDFDEGAPWALLEGPDQDDHAVAAYTECLAWIPNEEVRQARVDRLAEILSEQRALIAAKGVVTPGGGKGKAAGSPAHSSGSRPGWADAIRPPAKRSPSGRAGGCSGQEMRSGEERRQRNIPYEGVEKRTGKDRREASARAA